LPLSSEARADQGCRKRRNQVPDWSEITCRFPPKSPAAFDRNQVPVCSDFCIERFQKDNGLEQTATLDALTMVAMFGNIGTSEGSSMPRNAGEGTGQ